MQKIARADRDEVRTFKKANGAPIKQDSPKGLLISLVRSMQGKTRYPGVDLLVNTQTGERKGGDRFDLFINDKGRLVLSVYLRFSGVRRPMVFKYELDGRSL